MSKFIAMRADPNGDYIDDWDGVANEFATIDEAKEFVRNNAAAAPGVRFSIAKVVTTGEAPMPEVTFTDEPE
ncbi:MAG: hypothetical protein HC889_00590 [Synechococcaceae cyanobacterium SM1_2_3]|nr:hypothetical protein [Synechococcaceae cyanobacterium SM1_2_3]